MTLLTPAARRLRGAILALGLGLLSAAAVARGPAPLPTVPLAELPIEARETLTRVKAGGPFPYRKDGTVFRNYEGQLPQQSRGYYREYTVPTPGAKTRGARRIVAGEGATRDVRSSGEYYYTGDHYRSFRRIKE